MSEGSTAASSTAGYSDSTNSALSLKVLANHVRYPIHRVVDSWGAIPESRELECVAADDQRDLLLQPAARVGARSRQR